MESAVIDKPHVLVVEDDLKIVQSLVGGLHRAGFQVTVAMAGNEAVQLILTGGFDVILLDLMLPERSGFEIMEAMSGRVSTPVIVLSARTELEARLHSFELGAVDYVPKPFWIEEIVMRIRSRLSIRKETPHRMLSVGGVVLDLDRRSAMRDGQDLGLTAHEFNMLSWIVERPDRAISRQQLADNALPEDGERSRRTIDSHMSRIRKKLGEDGRLISTVWGIGYRYQPAGT
ncbi:MAG: two-component system OmpR family response regulator [Myxococcota bacterium]|jgi:two-component system OmpR family response regulator